MVARSDHALAEQDKTEDGRRSFPQRHALSVAAGAAVDRYAASIVAETTESARLAAITTARLAADSRLTPVVLVSNQPEITTSPTVAAERERLLALVGPADPVRSAEFIEEKIDRGTQQIREYAQAGDFAMAASAAQQLAAQLDVHARSRTWELGRGIND